MRRFTVGLVVLVALVAVPSGWSWTWPLAGDVLRPYSLGPDPYAAGQHRGVDVAGGDGESVRSPAAGVISFAGSVPGSGRTVTIQAAGYAVSVTHLAAITTSKGATIPEGGVIGIAGQTGGSEWPSPYVHLGIRTSDTADGYLDPMTLLPPRAVIPPPPAAQPIPPVMVAPAQPAAAASPETTPLQPSSAAPPPAPVAAPALVNEPPRVVDAMTPAPAPTVAPVSAAEPTSVATQSVTARGSAGVLVGVARPLLSGKRTTFWNSGRVRAGVAGSHVARRAPGGSVIPTATGLPPRIKSNSGARVGGRADAPASSSGQSVANLIAGPVPRSGAGSSPTIGSAAGGRNELGWRVATPVLALALVGAGCVGAAFLARPR